MSPEQLAVAAFAAMLPAGTDVSELQGLAPPAQAAKQPAAVTPAPPHPTDTVGPPSHTPPAPESAAKQRKKAAEQTPPISPQMQTKIRKAKAANFEAVMPAAYLQLGVSQVLPVDEDTGVYQAYFDQLMLEAGDAVDPVERMLLQGIAITFHRGGQPLVKAAQAETLQAAGLYNKAATSMYAEFRRQALSLEAYRASSAARRRADAATPKDSEKKSPALRCVP
jgi:hypothetical protein